MFSRVLSEPVNVFVRIVAENFGCHNSENGNNLSSLSRPRDVGKDEALAMGSLTVSSFAGSNRPPTNDVAGSMVVARDHRPGAGGRRGAILTIAGPGAEEPSERDESARPLDELGVAGVLMFSLDWRRSSPLPFPSRIDVGPGRSSSGGIVVV